VTVSQGRRTASLSRKASTVAERGSPEIRLISPTISPGEICATGISSVSAATKTPRRPLTRM